MIIEDWLLIISGVIFSVIIWDLYRHRRIAKRIAEAQKMETVGRLAGGVAHDFNNMLAGINSAADYIKLKLGPDHELNKYAQIITDSCIRASQLTHRLLLFARSQSAEKMRIDVHAGLDETGYLLEHSGKDKVKVIIEKKATKHIICGYPDLVHHMILNLGINAKDAMAKKGEIKIVTKNIELKKSDIKEMVMNVKSGEYLEISVSDKGNGIPKEIQNKIFEPFFTTKGEGKGSGLGLAAVYGIVRRHEGTIKVDSSSQGTTFRIYLPLADDDCQMELYNPHPTCSFPRKLKSRIMIIDDEVLLVKLLKDILNQFDVEVVTETESLKAVSKYQTLEADIVMLDVVMPEKNGIEIYEELKKINPNQKIIFMSGYSEDSRLDKILATDSNTQFIAKPYQINEVIDKVSKLLAKN